MTIKKEIHNYIQRNFPKKKILEVKNLHIEDGNTDIWGFKSIPIVVKEVGEWIHYQVLKAK